jgi:hypothetical protein
LRAILIIPARFWRLVWGVVRRQWGRGFNCSDRFPLKLLLYTENIPVTRLALNNVLHNINFETMMAEWSELVDPASHILHVPALHSTMLVQGEWGLGGAQRARFLITTANLLQDISSGRHGSIQSTESTHRPTAPRVLQNALKTPADL